jgi:hypothetical protein
MDEELSAAASIVWDPGLLAPIIELNERLLERLHASALAAATTHEAPALVQCLLHDWRALHRPAQRRLAQCPYLLLDAGFEDAARWQGCPLAVHEADGGVEAVDEAWLVLVRRALLLGWHLARAQPLAARVLLGMSALSAECMAARRLTDLDDLAVQEAARMAPRWQHQPQIWRQLLRASHGSAQELLWAQLRGLQLLAAARTTAAAGAGA